MVESFTIREDPPSNVSTLVQDYTTLSEIYRIALDFLRGSNLHIKIAAARLLSFSFFIQKASEETAATITETSNMNLNEITELITNPCYPLRVQSTGLILAIPQQASHPNKALFTHLTQRLSYHLLFRIVGVLKEKRNCNLSLSTLEDSLDTFKTPKELPILNKMVNELKTWHNSHKQLLLVYIYILIYIILF